MEEGSSLFNLEEGKELFCLNREYDPIVNRYYQSLDEVFSTLIDIRRSITPIFSGEMTFEQKNKEAIQLLFGATQGMKNSTFHKAQKSSYYQDQCQMYKIN